MTINKRVFPMRPEDEVFVKIGLFATSEHSFVTNYMEYVLLKHLIEVEHDKVTSSRAIKKRWAPLYNGPQRFLL